MDSVRIDKWLWAVRLFKSRTKANRACKKKKVFVNENLVKPANPVSVGDIVAFKKNNYNLTFKVLKLLKKRKSYSIAKHCYDDLTPVEEYNKFEDWYRGKTGIEYREKGAGRPTKKERRDLDRFKKKLYENDLKDKSEK